MQISGNSHLPRQSSLPSTLIVPASFPAFRRLWPVYQRCRRRRRRRCSRQVGRVDWDRVHRSRRRPVCRVIRSVSRRRNKVHLELCLNNHTHTMTNTYSCWQKVDPNLRLSSQNSVAHLREIIQILQLNRFLSKSRNKKYEESDWCIIIWWLVKV